MELTLSLFPLHHVVRPPLPSLTLKQGWLLVRKLMGKGCAHCLSTVACWETLAMPLASLAWWIYNWLLRSFAEIRPAWNLGQRPTQ